MHTKYIRVHFYIPLGKKETLNLHLSLFQFRIGKKAN